MEAIEVLKLMVKETNSYQKENNYSNDRAIGFADGYVRAMELLKQ